MNPDLAPDRAGAKATSGSALAGVGHLRHGADRCRRWNRQTCGSREGDFVALVGPSGCGKSTILRLVSGLVRPTGGVIIVGGREVAAKALRVGMAFQNPTMLPWLTIEQNIMLPLKIVEPFPARTTPARAGRLPRQGPCAAGAGRPEGVRRELSLAALGRHASARQPLPRADPRAPPAAARRALRRARPVHPRGTVGDPAGSLDRRRPTVLLVTHDLHEAGFLGSRICVMSARPGRIIDDSPVTFPRPRTVAMTFEPDFVALNQRLRELIVDARGDPPERSRHEHAIRRRMPGPPG